MRAALLTMLGASTALSAARAQTATVTGQVVLHGSGEQPLAYTTVSVLSQAAQLLTSENGTFTLRNLPPGEVLLRFKRIGFVPKDTALAVAANETARIRIEMMRLVLQLPEVVVNGTCTDRTPLEEQPPILAALFDQIRQNAERLRLLAVERPFVLRTIATGGFRDRDNIIIGARRADTVERGPLPSKSYVPRQVFSRGSGPRREDWSVTLPELPDLADTAFTNNHCLFYAGRERFESDSVIRVDFEPVPWLAREIDLLGSIYLRLDGFRLVSVVTRLNRIPSRFPEVREYFARARFDEIVSGVPVLADWELTNLFNDGRPPYFYSGKVTSVRWLHSPTTKRDTVERPPR
jgi:hypothetical protein